MSEIGKVATRRRNGEQLPLALPHEAAKGRDDLVVSERLDAAVSLIDRWPNWPSPVVILVGPAGSGKSHLATVWREMTGAVDICPDERGDAASAAAAEGPVIFEDADRVGFDDTALFHTINSVRENGTSLLMTSRAWPLSWPVELADLRSRLRAATVIEIGAPDEALLSQLIVKLFADRQLHIDDRIVDYIVDRMDRSFDAAMAVVERMDKLALSRHTRITRAIAAEVLGELNAADSEDDLSQ